MCTTISRFGFFLVLIGFSGLAVADTLIGVTSMSLVRVDTTDPSNITQIGQTGLDSLGITPWALTYDRNSGQLYSLGHKGPTTRI